ncbi:MAG TPA: 2-C-methyl-D-erythritol 2,4-cyclodiphosphate synthase [Bacteroidota bacterium]|nr:2-C-methyl-D-erythritol 2,4-cyclodiphosphate synthase [Bacteroidota bacterium]
MRFGIGYDVHRLVTNRKLILGGVEIPFVKGLIGHSDADVLCHALADALLGAAALGDIGKHFPDSDSRFMNISSLVLLKHVGGLIRSNNYEIVNVDTTLLLQQPKIAPYIKRMRENIAQALGLHLNQVSVKATTNEELGFIGMGEGAAAYAISSIRSISFSSDN